jgi:hypothetical protein
LRLFEWRNPIVENNLSREALLIQIPNNLNAIFASSLWVSRAINCQYLRISPLNWSNETKLNGEFFER